MPEIKEVIRRLYMTPREFAERFPECALIGQRDRVMVEEVYRPAQPEEHPSALLIEAPPTRDEPWSWWPRQALALRGTRFASGRWLSQTPQPQQAQDAAEEERAPG